MAKIYSNKIAITVESPNPNKCTVGQYITINGKTYKYEYTPTPFPPSTYDKYPATPNFCVYYTGRYIVYSAEGILLDSGSGLVPTGCYCYPRVPGSDLFVSNDATWFQTDGKGNWFAGIYLNTSEWSWQIRILWSGEW